MPLSPHHSELQAENCAIECQLDWEKPQEVKDNSYKLSKKPPVKPRSIATLLLTNLGSRSNAAQGQKLSYCNYTERDGLTRESLSTLV